MVKDFFIRTPKVIVSNSYLLELIVSKLEVSLKNVNLALDSKLIKVLRAPNKESAFTYIASLKGKPSEYVITGSKSEILINDYLNDLIKESDCSTGDFIAALSYAKPNDLVDFDEATIKQLITNCSSSQEVKLFILTQLDLLTEGSYSQQVIEIIQNLNPKVAQ